MSPPPRAKQSSDEQPRPPMERFKAARLTRKESIVKEEIKAYHVSEVDNTEVIYVGKSSLSVDNSLDLPDVDCDGLTFKQRLIETEKGDCLLIARWKPDRHMRRTAPDWSQKWFVEKELFPPSRDRLFARLEKRMEANSEDEQAGASKE